MTKSRAHVRERTEQVARTYLTPGVYVQDLLRLLLLLVKGQQHAVVALQVLLVQRDQRLPAGGGAGAPHHGHVLGHGFSSCSGGAE